MVYTENFMFHVPTISIIIAVNLRQILQAKVGLYLSDKMMHKYTEYRSQELQIKLEHILHVCKVLTAAFQLNMKLKWKN